MCHNHFEFKYNTIWLPQIQVSPKLYFKGRNGRKERRKEGKNEEGRKERKVEIQGGKGEKEREWTSGRQPTPHKGFTLCINVWLNRVSVTP